MMINTYNESQLHNTLKNFYAKTFHGQQEVKYFGYICDIIGNDGTIYEIQTGNFANIKNKLTFLLKENKVHLIYPIATKKYILKNYNEKNISKRLSPKKQNIYSIFRPLMSIYPILLNKNFTLEVLFTEQTECRSILDSKVQIPNKSRRFLKNYIKTDKILNNINGCRFFSSKEDYLSLLPKDLPSIFCTQDLFLQCGKSESYSFLWILRKLELIELVEKNKKNFYRIKQLD